MRSLDTSLALFVYSFKAIILWHVWVRRLVMYFLLVVESLLRYGSFIGLKVVIDPLVTFVEHIIIYLYI